MKQPYYIIVAALALAITTGIVSLTAFAASNNQANMSPRPNKGQQQNEMRQAIINNDYEAWSQMMQQRVNDMRTRADLLEDEINTETFNQRVQIHELIQEGDMDGAKELMEEYGIGGPGKIKGMKRGLHIGQAQNAPPQN